MASCFFTNVWNPDISHGHGHLMISNPCLQNSFTGSCRALQSNLLFMMSPHKVPVKRCFSLCNTENFFPVFRTVLFGLCTASRDLLTMFTRSPKLCTALPFSIFIFLFSPWESNLSAFHLWSFLPVPIFAELFFFPGFWYNGSS